MSSYLLIFIGCGIGGVFRYFISTKINSVFNATFPYGTLTVNVMGSFLIGLFFIIISNKIDNNFSSSEQIKTFLLTGVLGGYTTFSSFSFETVSLIESGDIIPAIMNISFTVILCISFAFLGSALGKYL